MLALARQLKRPYYNFRFQEVFVTNYPVELYGFSVAMSNICKLCGVHGTTEPCKQSIKKNGFFPGRGGQLGGGCYFFFCSLGGRKAALNWASSDRGKRQAPISGVPTTISAQIEVAEDSLIDLSSNEEWMKIHDFSQRLRKLFPDNPKLVNNKMKTFLNDLVFEKARRQGTSYASSVIVTWYPPFDGSVNKQQKCFVVKGQIHTITVCDGISNVQCY